MGEEDQAPVADPHQDHIRLQDQVTHRAHQDHLRIEQPTECILIALTGTLCRLTTLIIRMVKLISLSTPTTSRQIITTPEGITRQHS